MSPSKPETKIVILLILAFTLGLLIGLWLLRSDDDDGDDRPPKGRYYDPRQARNRAR